MDRHLTSVPQVDNVPHHESVSGWSVFWALLAIVSNAMLQPSFTGYLWNGNAFEGSLWPHRSSPFVCLIDMAADIFVAFQAWRSHGHSHEEGETGSARTGALTKLALFLIGVMPQAIKLLSMQGIPVTQAIAAMYLLSSATNLICSLTISQPQREIQKLLESLTASGLRSKRSIQRTTCIVGWGPHLFYIFLLWYSLADKVGFAAPADIENVSEWVCEVVAFLAVLYFTQYALCIMFEEKPLVACEPLFAILTSTRFLCIPVLIAAPAKDLSQGLVSKPRLTIELLVSLGLACYSVAIALNYVVDKVYKQCARCGTHHWRVLTRRCLVADSSNLAMSTAGETAVSEDLCTSVAAELGIRSSSDSTQTNTAADTLQRRSPSISDDNAAPISDSTTLPSQILPGTFHGTTSERTTSINSVEPRSISSLNNTPQDNTAESATSSWKSRAKRLFKNIFFGLTHPIVVLLVLVISYSTHRKSGSRDNEITSEQQSAAAAEEGTIGTPGTAATTTSTANSANQLRDPAASPSSGHSWTDQSSPLPLLPRIARPALRLLDTIPRLAVLSLLLLAWRLSVVADSLCSHTFTWVKWQVMERHPPRILVVAFGYVNFVTAAVYYLVFFDGDGTFAPGWADIFG